MAASTTSLDWNPIGFTDLGNETEQPLVTGAELTTAHFGKRVTKFQVVLFRKGRKRWLIEVATERQDLPAWLFKTIDSFRELLVLPPDWNGPDSAMIQPATLSAAANILGTFMTDGSSVPQTTPTPKGGVQFDWHENGVDLEIEFLPGAFDGEVLFSDHTNILEDWEGSVSENLGKLQSLFTTRLHAGSQR